MYPPPPFASESANGELGDHYYANGQRIGSRAGDDLYYFLGDHPSTSLRTGFGSTTVVADAEGNKVGHVLYDPYGEIVENTLPHGATEYLFTGYCWDDTIGLYDANARFYDLVQQRIGPL